MTAETSTSDWTLVEDDAGLDKACRALAKERILAIDTEFVGERTYRPDLELVQLRGVKGTPWLIDVRGPRNLKPLAKLLGNPESLKVLHAGGQDLPLLNTVLGVATLPVFDTQLAAAMAGIGAQVSYANLVRDCLGSRVDKGQTVSDWSRRPLSRKQLDYAAVDVMHLHDLHAYLTRELESLGRMAWFDEEQTRRANESLNPEVVAPEDLYMQVKEWTKLSPKQLVILRELALWRDNEARTSNLPRRMVLKDDVLIALALTAPEKRDDLKAHRNLASGAVHRHLDVLLPLIRKAQALPRSEWPGRRSSGERVEIPTGLVEVLQALLRTVAERERIASQLLATSQDLTILVLQRHKLDTVDLPVLRGWRRELVGQHLLDVLEGRVGVRVEDRERLVFEDQPERG